MVLAKKWLGIFIIGILVSCTSHRDTILFGDFDQITNDRNSLSSHRSGDYLVRSRDLLFVTISFLDSDRSFLGTRSELPDDNYDRTLTFRPTDVYYRSYTVSDSGYLSLPIIGSLYVAGQTTNQIRRILDQALLRHFKLATAQVKLANMRVTVLGEVLRPGNHFYFDAQMNIYEAISKAGNFNEFANRKRVKVVRQISGGKKSTVLNLNKIDPTHPYFTVQPGDIIYVEPLRPKAIHRAATSIGIVLSAVSTAVIIGRLIVAAEKGN